MKKLVALLALFMFVAVGPLLILTTQASAQFDPLETSCLEGSTTNSSAVCEEANNTDNPLVGNDGILTTVANLLSLAAGVIAVIIIVVAGIQMTLSGGDSQKVTNSRNAIIYAAVGIAVIVVARSIVLFVINRIG